MTHPRDVAAQTAPRRVRTPLFSRRRRALGGAASGAGDRVPGVRGSCRAGGASQREAGELRPQPGALPPGILVACSRFRFWPRARWRGRSRCLGLEVLPQGCTPLAEQGAPRRQPVPLSASLPCSRRAHTAPTSSNTTRPACNASQVIDPWGEMVARFEDPLATGVITADIDLGLMRRVREKMPIQEHRARGRRLYLGE